MANLITQYNYPNNQAKATAAIPVFNGSNLPPGPSLGYVLETGFTTAAVLSSVPTGATCVVMVAEGTAGTIIARMRDDGTNPTTSSGWPLYGGTPVTYCGADLATLKIISQSGSSVSIDCWFT